MLHFTLDSGVYTKYGIYPAVVAVKTNLYNFQIFHTDRCSEFKNCLIDNLLKEFNIRCSLSAKGCPYDNAVVKAQFKIIKTEFICSRRFENLSSTTIGMIPIFSALSYSLLFFFSGNVFSESRSYGTFAGYQLRKIHAN
ncbi:MAG TPA: hypothetical protein DCP97_04625 [Ruminococcaceae bacterium]|nr:hypothetical protein [Oscillospiraceae bacterium]